MNKYFVAAAARFDTENLWIEASNSVGQPTKFPPPENIDVALLPD